MRGARSFLSRGSLEHEHLHHTLMELSKGTDRSVAILVASMIDLALTETLKIFLHPNKKVTYEMFRPTGPLGSFSSKVHLGLLVGLYGPSAHRDLITIRDIRNAFAHSLKIHNFKHQKINSLSMNLKLCERYSTEMETSEKHDEEVRKKWAAVSLKDKPYWIFVSNRDEALKDPRERYIMTAEVFSYGLVVPRRTAMPAHLF